MSDAIVLDVAEQPTIALDVGSADPVARNEIAALAARIAALEAAIPNVITYTVDDEGDLTLGLTRTEDSNG